MNSQLLLLDAHAHYHQCFDRNEFLEKVFENFAKIANLINNKKKWIGILFLTEIKEDIFFSTLKNRSGIIDSNRYRIKETSEDTSIIISSGKEQKIIIIASKQIIAKNGIEVLALGTTLNFDNGRNLEETINEIKIGGALTILPWGVGKWLGKRKRILDKFIFENHNLDFFLGDNGGRPIFWSEPDIFKIGRSSNHFILPGSDALSFPTEINKTGSFGFYLDAEINLNEPTKCLINLMLNLKSQPSTFGTLEKPLKFLENQIKMQLKKQFK